MGTTLISEDRTVATHAATSVVQKTLSPSAAKQHVGKGMLYAKHLCIRTTLERHAKSLRRLVEYKKRLTHPELEDIYLEDMRIEHVLRRQLPRDANCVDVGAHIGSMLSLMVKICPAGLHWAFEPVSHKARWLRHKFPEVNIHQLALSNHCGQVTFFEDLAEPGYSSLGQPLRKREAGTRSYTIECSRADDVLKQHPGPINFVKIDVEGAELNTLDGAREMIAAHRPLVLLECTPDGLRRFSLSHADFYNFVNKELGYELRTPMGQLQQAPALSLGQFIESQTYPFRAFNYFACPPAETTREVGSYASDASRPRLSA